MPIQPQFSGSINGLHDKTIIVKDPKRAEIRAAFRNLDTVSQLPNDTFQLGTKEKPNDSELNLTRNGGGWGSSPQAFQLKNGPVSITLRPLSAYAGGSSEKYRLWAKDSVTSSQNLDKLVKNDANALKDNKPTYFKLESIKDQASLNFFSAVQGMLNENQDALIALEDKGITLNVHSPNRYTLASKDKVVVEYDVAKSSGDSTLKQLKSDLYKSAGIQSDDTDIVDDEDTGYSRRTSSPSGAYNLRSFENDQNNDSYLENVFKIIKESRTGKFSLTPEASKLSTEITDKLKGNGNGATLNEAVRQRYESGFKKLKTNYQDSISKALNTFDAKERLDIERFELNNRHITDEQKRLRAFNEALPSQTFKKVTNLIQIQKNFDIELSNLNDKIDDRLDSAQTTDDGQPLKNLEATEAQKGIKTLHEKFVKDDTTGQFKFYEKLTQELKLNHDTKPAIKALHEKFLNSDEGKELKTSLNFLKSLPDKLAQQQYLIDRSGENNEEDSTSDDGNHEYFADEAHADCNQTLNDAEKAQKTVKRVLGDWKTELCPLYIRHGSGKLGDYQSKWFDRFAPINLKEDDLTTAEQNKLKKPMSEYKRESTLQSFFTTLRSKLNLDFLKNLLVNKIELVQAKIAKLKDDLKTEEETLKTLKSEHQELSGRVLLKPWTWLN